MFNFPEINTCKLKMAGKSFFKLSNHFITNNMFLKCFPNSNFWQIDVFDNNGNCVGYFRDNGNYFINNSFRR